MWMKWMNDIIYHIICVKVHMHGNKSQYWALKGIHNQCCSLVILIHPSCVQSQFTKNSLHLSSSMHPIVGAHFTYNMTQSFYDTSSNIWRSLYVCMIQNNTFLPPFLCFIRLSRYALPWVCHSFFPLMTDTMSFHHFRG